MPKINYALLFIVFSILRLLSAILLALIGSRFSIIASNTLYFYSKQSILTFSSAIAIFLYFVNTKFTYNKVINLVASTTFRVYLTHDNEYVRHCLWHTVFNNAHFQNSITIITYSIVVSIIVFFFCSIVEFFRIHYIETRFIKLVGLIVNYILSKLPKKIKVMF